MKKRKKERPITKKEAGFIKDYLKTGNGTKSALKNYNTKSPNVAGVIAHQNLRKRKVRRVIKSFADRIPDTLLEEKHLELLNVPRKVRTFLKGELSEEIEELDSAAVSKGLDMGYKLKGYYKTEPPDPGASGPNQTLESVNTLIKMLKEEREKNKK